MSEIDLEKFHTALAETELAFYQSPTKGLVIWESLLLPKDDKGIVTGLIERFKKRIENGEDNENKILEKTVNNLLFIRSYVLKDERCVEAIDKIKKKILDQMATESLLKTKDLP